MYLYIYMYIYTHTHIQVKKAGPAALPTEAAGSRLSAASGRRRRIGNLGLSSKLCFPNFET